MADPSLFRLRVVFGKTGRLAMLSHLEVARSLERAVRRAHLPYAVSQGFSPHMRIGFGAALPVGVGGMPEFYDVFLTCWVDPEEALSALQKASPEDLMPVSCGYVEASAPAASVACPFSTYEARFNQPIDTLVVPETITVIRKKKEKILPVTEYLQGDIEVKNGMARYTLEAKPTGSLRPDKLLAACCEQAGNGLAVTELVRVAQTVLPPTR